MIKLYYAAHTCSLASHTLEDAGADYSTVRISRAEEQRKPNFRHQSRGAPALVTDRGF
jgi:hypothetical protein